MKSTFGDQAFITQTHYTLNCHNHYNISFKINFHLHPFSVFLQSSYSIILLVIDMDIKGSMPCEIPLDIGQYNSQITLFGDQTVSMISQVSKAFFY